MLYGYVPVVPVSYTIDKRSLCTAQIISLRFFVWLLFVGTLHTEGDAKAGLMKNGAKSKSFEKSRYARKGKFFVLCE